MSGAIWGIIHMNNSEASIEHGKYMMDKLSMYKLDSIKYINKDNVFMGCGLQYITSESEKEILPFYDEDRGLIITADAIIDNREELFSEFNISKESWICISDSELIILAYEKWGQDSPKYLIGDFAFVIWDDKNQELFCARDHVGTRTFYYSYSNNIFSFCTVIKPLIDSYNKDIELNERWITDFLALPLTLHQCECSQTIYEGICQLLPANTIVLKENRIIENQYWNPLKEVKSLKLKSDKEYEELFRKTFFEAVKCRLRSNNEVGIMLSGGIDSASVVCVAAKQLSENNKTIKAFTSIPISEFKNNLPKYKVADETEYIESIKDYYDNVDISYCRSDGKNSLSDIDFLINVLEQPHKIIENLFWYNNIMQIAENQLCKVMLNGQFGNYTISYGDFLAHILTLYRKGKLLNMLKEIDGFSNLYKVPKARVRKLVLRTIAPYGIRKFVNSKIRKNIKIFDRILVNKNLAEKWNIKDRFKTHGLYTEIDKYYDFQDNKKNMVNPIVLCQMASIETKLSLAHGMIVRDPTRDKRVIEFCISLPSEQFVRNGHQRYLVRRALKGILPDKIRLNISTRGLQSADWIQRLEPQWKEIYIELQSMLDSNIIKKYLDMDKLKDDLILLKDSIDEKYAVKIRRLLVSLVFWKFISKYNK